MRTGTLSNIELAKKFHSIRADLDVILAQIVDLQKKNKLMAAQLDIELEEHVTFFSSLEPETPAFDYHERRIEDIRRAKAGMEPLPEETST